MAFGLGKKREGGRSSRPLSMILPEHVRLFNKKNRSVVDRVIQEQNKKGIEGNTTRQPEDSANHFHGQFNSKRSSMMPVYPSKDAMQTEASHLKAEQDKEVREAPHASRNVQSKQLEHIEQHAPILTLDLESNRHSLLGLTEHYSYSDNSPVVGGVSSPTFGASHVLAAEKQAQDSPAALESLEQHSNQNRNEDIKSGVESPIFDEETLEIANLTTVSASSETSLSTSGLDSSLSFDSSLALDSSQKPQDSLAQQSSSRMHTSLGTKSTSEWTPRARDTPMIGDTFNLSDPDTSPEIGSSFCKEPSLDEEQRSSDDYSSQPNSTWSEASTLSNTDERVVDSNRKIVLHRGVYIFGACDSYKARTDLKLNDDDMMNPFEVL